MAVVNGTKGNDTIFVDGGNDVVKAGNGNDYIYAGAGNDVITGGSGVNTIDFNTIKLPFETEAKPMGHDIVNLTKGETLTLDCSSKTEVKSIDIVGKDVVVSFGDNETITLKNFATKDVVGSKGNINLTLANEVIIDLKSYLYDFTGFNKKGVYSGKWLGEDIDASGITTAFDKKGVKGVSVNGNNGDDSITGSQFADTLKGGNGDDIIRDGDKPVVIVPEGFPSLPGNVADSFGTKGYNDKIYAGAGDDEVYTNAGDDVIYAGAGDDKVVVLNGNQKVYGEAGKDSLIGGLGKDTIYGGNDDDTIKAGGSDDAIYGGKGNDTLNGGNGNDTFVFYKKDGADVVEDATSVDVIKFADRTNFAGLTFEQVKDENGNLTADLVIYDKYNNITIKNYFVENGEGNWEASENAVNQFALKKGVYTLEWKNSNVYGEGMYNVSSAVNEKKGTITSVAGIKNWIDAGEYDKVTGAYAGDMLAGNQGNDTISASKVKGNVEIFGGEGNDNLTGGTGNDWIAGNENNDLIKGGKGNDILLGGDHETKKEGSGDDIIYGGDGKDSIYGGDGADKLYGDKGDDYVVGGIGADTIYGGDGNDEIHATYMKNPAANPYGNVAADNSTNKIDGGAGNDTIYSGLGADTIYGGKGNDSLEVFGANSVTYAGDGNDEITLYYDSAKTVYGEKGDDYISIEYGQVEVYGGAGNDFLESGLMNNSNLYFNKGDGRDTYHYRGALKFTSPTAGDTVNSEDTLIFKNASASELSFKQNGDDLIISYSKKDSVTVKDYCKFFNAEGDDLSFVDDRGNKGYYVDKSANWKIYVETKDGGKVLLSDMIKSYYGTTGSNKITTDKELVYALAGNDKVTITGDGSTVLAGEGNDTVQGGAGQDYILGEAGNDFIDGQEGQNYLMGGAGDDQILGGSDYDYVEGGEGADVIYGNAGDDYLLGNESADTIYGGDGNDTIMASTYLYGEIPAGTPTVTDYYSKYLADGSANVIDSGNGDDRIWGSDGADTINAGDGVDKVYAFGEGSVIDLGNGDDHSNLYQNTAKTLYAGAGNDTVSVEFGKATVTGGTGDDALWGGYVSDSTFKFAAGDGNDKYRYRGYTTSSGTGTPTYCSDTLVFENVSSADMTFAQDGENLVITYADDSSVALENFFKDGSNSANWNVYIQTTEGTALLSDMVGLQNLLLKLATPEGAIAGTVGNDEFTAEKESAVVYGYNGDDTFTVSNDWAARGDEAGKTTTVTFDGGVGNDTFKFGYGTYDANVSGGAGADVFDFTGSWPHDVWMEEEKQIATGANITISDISADDKVIFSQYTANHMAGEGVYVNDSADGYAKYSMIFDVTLDKEGNATADLSKITFSLKDAGTIADKWNDELGMPNTSFVLQTEDGSSLVDTAKIFVRDAEGNDVEYKFNETVINQITEKVASWLSTETEYGSVMEAIADGNKDVLAQFVNAVKPYDQGFGTESYVGEDILVPVV